MTDAPGPSDSFYDLPRVLIVDNERSTRDRLATLLKLWNYQPYVVEAEGEDLLLKAISMAHEHCCHLALVDLRLGDDNDPKDTSGLRLVPLLRPAEVIIFSGFLDYKIILAGLSSEEKIYFVHKEESPERLRSELDKVAVKICASQRNLEVSPQRLVNSFANNFYPEKGNIPKGEAVDVLARLFPDASKMCLRLIESPRRQSLTRVPRPRSLTLLVFPDDLQPQVVKLARARKIKQEVERYQKYIENRLVGHFSPPIKTWSATWNLGGAVYPFMGASAVTTFATYYSKSSIEDVKYSLAQLFERTWSDLYRSARSVGSREKFNLFDAYSEVWEAKWYNERVQNFPSLNLPALMPPQAVEAPDPVNWLKDWVNSQQEIPLTALAVTHGDLHGDNILVDENRNVWAIDFERSGPGPVLQDFVELETDILTRLAGGVTDNFSALYRLGVWVAQPTKFHKLPNLPESGNPQLLKAMEAILFLRQLAHKMTGESDARPYLWGLLLNMIFRATLVKSKRRRQSLSSTKLLRASQRKALMLGSIICHRLEHWKQPWPPADWPPHSF